MKPSDRFDEWKSPEFDENGLTEYNWICQNRENLELSEYTDIGAFTYINAKEGVVIEKNVQIGPNCSIISSSSIDGKKGKIHLKENSRIGANSVVMPGVEVGENTVIGALSLVNESIPPNVIAFGRPVKVRKSLENAK